MYEHSGSRRSADAISVGLSSLCLLHCLVLPAIVSLSPIIGVVSQEWVHQILVVIAAPVSLSVLRKTVPGPDRYLTGGLIGVGLSCLFAGAFVEAWHDHEKLLTVIGGSTLAMTHAFRWWKHKLRSYTPEDHL